MSVPVLRVRSPEEAVRALQEHGPGARLVAGGTDAFPPLRRGLEAPSAWIDLSGLQGEPRLLAERDGGLWLGALLPWSELRGSALLRRWLPALADAARLMGAPQIRERGTLGGNLAHASPAGDSAPPLLVAGARLHLLGPGGRRELPVEDFFLGPGRSALGPAELLLGAWVPPQEGWRSAFHRLGTRALHEISKVSLALALRVEGGRIAGARAALGSVAPRPVRAPRLEAALRGCPPDGPLEAAAAAVLEDVSPIDDIRSTAAYRRAMSRELVLLLLERLLGEG